jgi:hypothetical protein
MLKHLVDDTLTDKNTSHSYLEVYDTFFSRIKNSAKYVLEVGVARGGGLKLLREYFQNAQIFGMDHNPVTYEMNPVVPTLSRISLFMSVDAYNTDNVNAMLRSPIRFNLIMDDGSHHLEHQKFFIEHYSKLLTDDGMLVVEDIADINYLPELFAAVPVELRPFVFLIDRRMVKGRSDDILLIIDKNGSK